MKNKKYTLKMLIKRKDMNVTKIVTKKYYIHKAFEFWKTHSQNNYKAWDSLEI